MATPRPQRNPEPDPLAHQMQVTHALLERLQASLEELRDRLHRNRHACQQALVQGRATRSLLHRHWGEHAGFC